MAEQPHAVIRIVRPDGTPVRLERLRRAARQVVRGGVVRPHVQAAADAAQRAGVASSFGTYPGHQPSIDLALDVFHPLGDRAAARRITDFALSDWEPGGYDYQISFNEIWNPEKGRYWRPHAGGNTPTKRHEDHVHWSFEPTGAAVPGPGPAPPPPPPPPEEDDMARTLFIAQHPTDAHVYLFNALDLTRKHLPSEKAVADMVWMLGAEGNKKGGGHYGRLRPEVFDMFHDAKP